MTPKMVPLEQQNSESRISLEILEQCSSNLAPEMYITKETECHLLCCCRGMLTWVLLGTHMVPILSLLCPLDCWEWMIPV